MTARAWLQHAGGRGSLVLRGASRKGERRFIGPDDEKEDPMGTARGRDKGDLITPSLDHGTPADTDVARARDRAEAGSFPDTSAPPPHDAPSADLQDLPRNEALRHGAFGHLSPEARAGETASQDIAPTEEDIRLEATLQRHRADNPDVHEWMSAQRRVEPGLDDDIEDTQRGDDDADADVPDDPDKA